MKTNRGFTLAEVIVSILILGLGLSMCAKMVARGTELRKKSRNLILAGVLAQRKVEETLAGIHPGGVGVEQGKDSMGLSATTPVFGWRRDVRGVPSEEDILEIVVRVSWMDRDVERSLQLVSYMYHRHVIARNERSE